MLLTFLKRPESKLFRLYLKCITLLPIFFLSTHLSAQDVTNPSLWFNPAQDWYQIVVQPGLLASGYNNNAAFYQLDVADLIPFGMPDNSIEQSKLKMYRSGKEIPIEIRKVQSGDKLMVGDKIRFLGERNTGKNEKWAYGNNGNNQATDYYSLYSDSTVYWLTWSDSPGLRYQEESNALSSTFYTGFRDTLHQEGELSSSFYPGHGEESELSTYGESEGFYWYDGNLASQTSFTVTFDAPIFDIVKVDSAIDIKVRMASQSSGSRTLRIDLLHSVFGSIAYHPIGSGSWSGKGGLMVSGSVSPVNLVDYNYLQLNFQALNGNTGAAFANPHLMLFDWYEYSYFRGFTIPNATKQFSFWLKPDGVRSVRFQNILLGTALRVFSPTQNKVFVTTIEDPIQAQSFFDTRASSQNQHYFVVKNEEYAQPVRIRRYQNDAQLLSASNEAEVIFLTRPSFKDQAQIYANYRASRSGVKTKVVLAEDIWNLFGYGIPSPKAIQDFVHYARKNWTVAPKYMFILADASFQSRFVNVKNTEIPSFGYPSSDAWYGMNQNGLSDWIPRVSVGRLTVQKPSEIIAYLSKVSQYEEEKPEYEAWQKRITLLSGGLDTGQREQLLNQNLKLAAKASNSLIAADTIIIGKKSNQPLDESARVGLSDIINSGTLLLHFYGHSSTDSWDLLTDNPSSYQNQGKYSVVLSLGCYSGLFTMSNSRVIAEQFVFAHNAAVAFIGGSGQGNPSALDSYSNFFYDGIFIDTLTVLGEVDQSTRSKMAQRYLNISTNDLALIQNSNIIGDPSLILAYPRKTDYRFDFNPVSFNPNLTNIADSTMQLITKVRNLGILPKDSTDLTIEQVRPVSGTRSFRISLPPIRNVLELPVTIPLDQTDAGLHQFNLMIDSEQILDEYTHLNNQFTAEHQVFSTGADLIYPLNNTIHNSKNPLFVVSSPTIFEHDTFELELDTLPDFSQPIAKAAIEATTMNVQWTPSIKLEHNRVYFWRAKVIQETESNWREASFLVDTTFSGTWWYQLPDEFDKNTFSKTLHFSENHEFSFNSNDLEIRTSSLSWNLANTDDYANYPASTFVNGEQMGRLSISFYMLVINGLTGEIRNGIDSQGIPRGQHYDVHPGIFTNAGSKTKAQFIQDLNAIRAGDYVILRVRNFRLISPQSPLFTGNTDPLLASLRSVGGFKAAGGVDGSLPPGLTTTDGYILFGKKFRNQAEYNPSEVSEYIIRDQIMEADTVLSFNANAGSMSSPLIGPVKTWHKLESNGNRISASGKIFIDIFGQQSTSSLPEKLNTANPTGLQSTISLDLNGIDAIQYPYLRLVARLENDDRKSPQLNQWKVQYTPIPELAINPFTVSVPRDTIEEGYTYSLAINVQNLGLIDADTAIVVFTDVYKPIGQLSLSRVVKTDTLYQLSTFRKNSVPPPVTSRRTSVDIPTIDFQGEHTLQVRFKSGYNDQLSYNNYYSRDYFVSKDTLAPRIEVFFDNRFIPPVSTPITNKENPSLSFVAAKPQIDIYWRDSNPYLRLSDSTNFEIRLFSQNPTDYQSYTMESPEIIYIPADSKSSSRNEAYIKFTPDFSAITDDALTLQIFAKDKVGNLAENDPSGYLVSFRVKNTSGMTSFYPYPNPMSSFTNFAFELQGQDVNDIERLKLKLFTLSGRPVKVVDLLNNPQLLNDGRLRIGWNVYRWDGKDDDGDRLATGVYLYHVDFKTGGKQIPVNNKNSIEKIVIIN